VAGTKAKQAHVSRGEPHPLSGYAGIALRRASLAVYGAFMGEVGTLGLKPAEYAALLIIQANPGARSADIAGLLGIEKANFTVFLRRLERRGWVAREVSMTDRRAHALHLTGVGTELLTAAVEYRARLEAGLVARLGAVDYARLVELLQVLLAPEATPTKSVAAGKRLLQAGFPPRS
jgi:DNA-binding MarR family transcriptional regulator